MKDIKLKPSYEEIEVEMETILAALFDLFDDRCSTHLEETDDPTYDHMGDVTYSHAQDILIQHGWIEESECVRPVLKPDLE